MTKNGKLSKRDIQTLDKAWGILSKWTEIYENDNESEDGCVNSEYEYMYDNAMAAVAGLCEFIHEYERV